MDRAKSTLNLLHAQMLVSEICGKLNVLKSAIYFVKKTNVAKSNIKLKKDPFKSIWQVGWELQIYMVDMRAKSHEWVQEHLIT